MEENQHEGAQAVAKVQEARSAGIDGGIKYFPVDDYQPSVQWSVPMVGPTGWVFGEDGLRQKQLPSCSSSQVAAIRWWYPASNTCAVLNDISSLSGMQTWRAQGRCQERFVRGKESFQ